MTKTFNSKIFKVVYISCYDVELSYNKIAYLSHYHHFQLEAMYKKCHAAIRADPSPKAKKEKKDVKVKR